jgi:hypothetical protein
MSADQQPDGQAGQDATPTAEQFSAMGYRERNELFARDHDAYRQLADAELAAARTAARSGRR